MRRIGKIFVYLTVLAMMLTMVSGFGTASSFAADSTNEAVVLYFIDEAHQANVPLPEGASQTYQIDAAQGATFKAHLTSNPSWSGKRVVPISVTDTGLVSTNISYYFDENGWCDAYVEVKEGSSVRRIDFKVCNYIQQYAETVMNQYLTTEITEGMTDLEKLKTITRIAAHNYEYDAKASSWQNMIGRGGGDCWASTDFIVEAGKRLGLNITERRANREPLAGSGHMNAIAEIDGELYIADAGFYSKKPRYYEVRKAEPFYCWEVYPGNGDEPYAKLVQYDGGWTRTDNPDTVIEIPSQYKGKPIRTIDSYWHLSGASKSAVVEYILPDTVRTINERGFSSTPNLERINLPEGLTSIGANAFAYCSKLDSIEIPDSLETLDSTAFTGCTSLKHVRFFSQTAYEKFKDVFPDCEITVLCRNESHEFNATGKCTICGYDPNAQIHGDVNGDKVVNDQDAVLFERFLAGWPGDVNEAAMDLDGNNRIDDIDCMLLVRYLAGWKVAVEIGR